MPTCTPRRNLSPHIAYFYARCRAKGASERKAREWARYQVKRGRRAPDGV